LAARDALGWLHLHREFALRPQDVTPVLETGASPESILARLRAGVGPRDRLLERDGRAQSLDRDVERLAHLGVRVVPRPDSAYPERLSQLIDAPSVLLVRGEVPSLRMPGIAIVGARAATEAARQTARRLARELAAVGLTIISGLARGIDAAAHRGALDVGGRTIAVLACGPDRIYPPEHRSLAQEICERGAIVSELPIGSPPRRAHFPLRNRLISGLSIGVIVVEARKRSGSLITVRHALNQGREVFVVPGAVSGPFAEGTNALLREGARPILSARDVVEDLGLERLPLDPPPNARAAEPASARDGGTAQGAEPDRGAADGRTLEDRVLFALGEGPMSREALTARMAVEPGHLARALLELELANRVIEDRDGLLQRNWR